MSEIMPHYHCCVSGCDNDSRYPDKIVKHGHVKGELHWHYLPKNPERRAQWTEQISKGLENFLATDNKVVCSNHVLYGKPRFASPKPTLYLVQSDKGMPLPRKRRIIDKETAKVNLPNVLEAGVQCDIVSPLAYTSLAFAILSRNHDVSMFTGLPSASAFECIFSFSQKKASIMHYWKGAKDARKETSNPRVNTHQRALTLGQEFLLCMMKLKVGLFLFDLAFRFDVLESMASSLFTTWVKLMAKELDWVISWPDRRIIQRNLPSMFRKYHPKRLVIIDCTELFIETLSSLEVAAMCCILSCTKPYLFFFLKHHCHLWVCKHILYELLNPLTPKI